MCLITIVICGVDQRCYIFRKAGTAPANASLQKLIADPRIQTNALSHLGDISADSIANICDFVDKANFRCQKRIGGIFDHFCRTQICDQDGNRWQRFVFSKLARDNRRIQFLHHGDGTGIVAAQHNPIRVEGVIHSTTFA